MEKNRRIKVPEGLGNAGLSLWKGTLSTYKTGLTHELALLEAACRCSDRLEAVRQILEREGPVVLDRFSQPMANPAAGLEQKYCSELRALLRQLDLPDLGEPKQPKPRYARG